MNNGAYDPFRYRREDLGSAEKMVPAIVLIGVGAIFLLNNLNIVYAHDVFRYWPAILIAAGIAKLVDAQSNEARAGGGILVGLGAFFLARNLGFIDIAIWDLWPVIPIAIGLLMLLDRPLPFELGTRVHNWKHGTKEAAVFSGGKRVIGDQNFTGAKYDAVFGGFEIDLRRANIAGDSAILELNAVFGGIEAKIPESWSVVMKGAGVFGGFVDNTRQPDPRLYPQPKTLIVRGGAVFGGVEIKN